MPVYTDQQIVAAFNGCLDLEKWNALPLQVRDRFLALFKAHMVKPVCFFRSAGFGLRVFMPGVTNVKTDGADEIDEITFPESGEMNIDSYWLRCPAEMYQTKELFLVMNDRGTQYVKERTTKDVDEDSGIEKETTVFRWSVSREQATRFTREEAEAAVARHKITNYVIVKE